MPISRLLLFYLVLMTIFCKVAWAQNLVVNGGFETGNFSSWTQFGSSNSGYPGYTGITSGGAPQGSLFAYFGPVSSTGGISQNFTTVIGQVYTISYFLQNDYSFGTHTFLAEFGNPGSLSTLESLTNPSSFGYTLRTFIFTATSTTSQIRFTFQNDPSYWRLDNVIVKDKVPEIHPSGARFPLTLLCLGLLILYDRRRGALRALG